MSQQIVIVGAGGSGREVRCLIEDLNRVTSDQWDFVGFLAADEPPPDLLERIDAKFLGSPSDRHLLAELGGIHFAVAIGNGVARRNLHGELSSAGLLPATLVHPTAVIGMDVDLGAGTVIGAGCVITTNVRLGVSVQVNNLCSIAHDCSLGDYVTLAPGVNVSGAVQIDALAHLGTNSATIQGVAIGASARIGAGAVVTQSIGAGVTAVGVPARPVS